MTRTRCITSLAAVATPLAVVTFAAFGSSDSGSAFAAAPNLTNARPAAVSVVKPAVAVRSSRLGKILVDSQGRTLYLFKKDSGTKSACFGACAQNWPPLRASGKPAVGRGAKASMIATTRRSDGGRQVTYNGHPLYHFVNDHKPGDTNGEGLNAFGGLWWVVSPAGNPVSKPVSNAGGGGTGY